MVSAEVFNGALLLLAEAGACLRLLLIEELMVVCLLAYLFVCYNVLQNNLTQLVKNGREKWEVKLAVPF